MRRWVFLIAVIMVFAGCASQQGQQSQEQSTSEPTREASTAPTTQKATAQRATMQKATTQATASGATTAPLGTAPDKQAASSAPKKSEAALYGQIVTVTKVVDGDTVDISPAVDGISRVRFIGVDTPETKKPGCEVQPYGKEASDYTMGTLKGQKVGLEFDQDKVDQYNRLLAYAYKDDGQMFNEDLLKGGYAQVATFPPNTKYVDRFTEDQEEAKASGVGIWGLSAEEQAQETDRGNGIGSGDGCTAKSSPPSSPPLQPSPRRSPAPAPTPSPAPVAPSVGGGKSCKDFSSQAEAQAALPSNPQLDRDKDGIACETLR